MPLERLAVFCFFPQGVELIMWKLKGVSQWDGIRTRGLRGLPSSALFPNLLSCLRTPVENLFPSDSVWLPGFQNSSQQSESEILATQLLCIFFPESTCFLFVSPFFLVRLCIRVSHHSTCIPCAQLMLNDYPQLLFCRIEISLRYPSLEKLQVLFVTFEEIDFSPNHPFFLFTQSLIFTLFKYILKNESKGYSFVMVCWEWCTRLFPTGHQSAPKSWHWFLLDLMLHLA